MPRIALVLVILVLTTTPGITSPCRDNGWQPTFVHDLVNGDPVPYYVMPDGSFVALTGDWANQSGPGMCCLYGVRDRRGFTTCFEYTRVQCGCDMQSMANDTCRRFLAERGVSSSSIPLTCETNEGSMKFTGATDGVLARYGIDEGRLVGTIRGSIIDGYWVEADSREKCSTPKDGSYYWGRIVATLEASGRRFNGKWAYCAETPTREWTGTCSGSASVGASNR